MTLIESNFNAYMSSSSNDGAEQHTVTAKILKREMSPIHKKGKAKIEASSYRPISLTSCIVKVL